MRPCSAEDLGVLWAAYQRGSFAIPEGLSQEQFLLEMHKQWAFPLLWVVEDDHAGFKSGRGLVALVGIASNGWVFSPNAVFLKWATPRNILRSLVCFFHMMKSRKEVGVCRVEVLEKERGMLERLAKYGVLFPRGRIPAGSVDGDTCIYSIQGGR